MSHTQHDDTMIFGHLYHFVDEVFKLQQKYSFDRDILEGIAKSLLWISPAAVGCNMRQAWLEHAVDCAIHGHIDGYKFEKCPPLGEKACYEWLANPYREVWVSVDGYLKTEWIPRTYVTAAQKPLSCRTNRNPDRRPKRFKS